MRERWTRKGFQQSVTWEGEMGVGLIVNGNADGSGGDNIFRGQSLDLGDGDGLAAANVLLNVCVGDVGSDISLLDGSIGQPLAWLDVH